MKLGDTVFVLVDKDEEISETEEDCLISDNEQDLRTARDGLVRHYPGFAPYIIKKVKLVEAE